MLYLREADNKQLGKTEINTQLFSPFCLSEATSRVCVCLFSTLFHFLLRTEAKVTPDVH